MKIAIIGSRKITIQEKFQINNWLIEQLETLKPTLLISGGAKGVDMFVRLMGAIYMTPFKEYLPDYKTYGKQAPLIRNKQIVDEADVILVGHMRIPSGTGSAVNYAKKIGKRVIIKG